MLLRIWLSRESFDHQLALSATACLVLRFVPSVHFSLKIVKHRQRELFEIVAPTPTRSVSEESVGSPRSRFLKLRCLGFPPQRSALS